MELIGSLFLVLALAVFVALFIARPFLLDGRHKTASGTQTAQQEREHQLSALLAERDRLLTALQELDFDYALGKVPQEDYPQQRAILLKTGADVLRRLDEFSMGEPESKVVAAEDRIEAVVAARRADSAQQGQAQVAQVVVKTNGNGHGKGRDELEEMIASRKRERKESAAGFCPHCGKPVQKSDKFCSKCGATL